MPHHMRNGSWSRTPAPLTTLLCTLLLCTGCRETDDAGYREVTASDIAPVAAVENPPVAANQPNDDKNTSAELTSTDPPPPPLATQVGSPGAIESPAVDPPLEPVAGTADAGPLATRDPVNPLRPALPDQGFSQPVNPLRPALPGEGLGQRPTPPGPPGTPGTKPAVATKPREIKLLIKERSFKSVGPDKALRVSYDDFDLLKVLNMEPVPPNAPSQMPGWLKQLDGKRIRVRGFMYPTFTDPVEVFVLARDNQICCFGRNPKIYDLVKVALRKGVSSPYIQNRPFDVVGLFHIAKKIEDGRLLYSIDDAIVVDR